MGRGITHYYFFVYLPLFFCTWKVVCCCCCCSYFKPFSWKKDITVRWLSSQYPSPRPENSPAIKAKLFVWRRRFTCVTEWEGEWVVRALCSPPWEGGGIRSVSILEGTTSLLLLLQQQDLFSNGHTIMGAACPALRALLFLRTFSFSISLYFSSHLRVSLFLFPSILTTKRPYVTRLHSHTISGTLYDFKL